MPRLLRNLATAVAILLASLLTACGATSYSYEQPEAAQESATVDPVVACAGLAAAPTGMAQERADELGCVKVGDNAWEYPTDSTPVEAAPPAESQPGGGISWNEAAEYAGTTQRVCGPLAGGGNSDDDVFLNLGRDYPDIGRFQIVVWDIGSLESIAGGATLCTSGPITLYEGVPQIELVDPSLIDIYE